ncbi:MAG: hypothetical protein WBP68_21085 [Candidatus Binatus sp.]
MTPQRIDIAIEVDASRRKRSSSLNRVFAESWNEGKPQLDCGTSFRRAYVPSSVKLLPGKQVDGIACLRRHSFRDARQVQHLCDAMGSYLEHHVTRFPKHPEVEGAAGYLRELAMPGNRKVIDRPEYSFP